MRMISCFFHGNRAARAVGLGLLALIVMISGAVAETALSGRSYADFAQSYQENIAFINENDGRHMLPLVIAGNRSDVNGARMLYELAGDVLTLKVTTDSSGAVIESCRITLTAPEGMTYGSAQYEDFTISGYHSYALLMAMAVSPTAAERFALVTEVNEGLAAHDGLYLAQVGAYTLRCTRQGNTAELLFENARVYREQEPEPTETLNPEEDFSQVG